MSSLGKDPRMDQQDEAAKRKKEERAREGDKNALVLFEVMKASAAFALLWFVLAFFGYC